jgi:hypothetical protein
LGPYPVNCSKRKNMNLASGYRCIFRGTIGFVSHFCHMRLGINDMTGND